MPGWGVCRGWCDRLGGLKRAPRVEREKEFQHRYFDGTRFCRGCQRYFTADMVERLDRQIYCICCHRKTSGRARHIRHNMKVKMENLLVVR